MEQQAQREEISTIKQFLVLTRDAFSGFGRALCGFLVSLWVFLVSLAKLLNPIGPTGLFCVVLGGWSVFGFVGYFLFGMAREIIRG